jgi:hypothetical protein
LKDHGPQWPQGKINTRPYIKNNKWQSKCPASTRPCVKIPVLPKYRERKGAFRPPLADEKSDTLSGKTFLGHMTNKWKNCGFETVRRFVRPILFLLHHVVNPIIAKMIRRLNIHPVYSKISVPL